MTGWSPYTAQSQLYYLGKGVGIIAMDYQGFMKANNDRLTTLNARLKKARMIVDPNLSVYLEGDFPEKTLYGDVHAQLSQFMTHRRNEDFEEKYGSNKAWFSLLRKNPDGSAEIKVAGDTSMGSWYKVKDRERKMLTRKLGGPISFIIDQKKNIKTEGEKYIAVYYDVTFYINEKAKIGVLTYDDQFEKKGTYWVPKVRSLKGKQPNMDGSLTDMDWHLKHTDVQALVNTILNGQRTMTPFKGKVTEREAEQLVGFVRTFAKKP